MEKSLILAGDIGGTKTNLALYEMRSGKVHSLAEETFPSASQESLNAIVKNFRAIHTAKISHACFGIAGPVKDGACITTNLPWNVDAASLAKDLSLANISLINDLEANAYGIQALKEEDFLQLNPGNNSNGNAAIIAAGTGLGEAGLYWDGSSHHIFACEGGHVDFAPQTNEEIALLQMLQKVYGHVSYERILSGPGINTLYEFILQQDKGHGALNFPKGKDRAAVICEHALLGDSQLCVRALKLFVSIYGAAASNLALKMMAWGGVFIGGGIAPKILPLLQEGLFMHAFLDKGRFSKLLKQIPVRVILNEKTAVLGASIYASKVAEKTGL